jgi:hypothetical protein
LRRWTITLLSIILCFGMVIPIAMAAPAAVNASLDNNTGIVTVSGNLGSAEGNIVTIQVRNPLNQLDYLDQSKSSTGGAYLFSYKLKERATGTYTVAVGGQSAVGVSTTTFNVVAPKAQLTAEVSPNQPDGQNGWYVHPVNVTIGASEGLPEGYQIQYRVNLGEWTPYIEAFSVNSNGTNTIEYRSVDDAGAPSLIHSLTIKIDTSAPVTSAAASQINGNNGWYVSNPTVTLTATDHLSVTQTVYPIQTFYRMNGSQWVNYTQPVTVATYGVSNFEYKSMDQAGNEEAAKSLTLKLDKTAPTVNITLNKSTLWPANNKFVTVTSSVYANDSISQIDSIVLTSITSNEPGQADDIHDAQFGTLDTSFSLRAQRAGSGSGRVYTITYTATDKAGNKTSATATVSVPHDQNGHNGNNDHNGNNGNNDHDDHNGNNGNDDHDGHNGHNDNNGHNGHND